jgi:hypothetical protein
MQKRTTHPDPHLERRKGAIAAEQTAHSCTTCGVYPPKNAKYHACINPACKSANRPVLSCAEHPPVRNVCKVCEWGTMKEAVRLASLDVACPACGLYVAAKSVHEVITHINSLCPSHARICPHAPNGCPEQVTTGTMDAHLKECKYYNRACDSCGFQNGTVKHDCREHLLAQLAEELLSKKIDTSSAESIRAAIPSFRLKRKN